jgi:hypothetical protein
VFHQDYIVSRGHNTVELERRVCTLLDVRGGQYPAEHNVGHLYGAKPALINHYVRLDPCNCFNPGIGRTSKCMHWRGDQHSEIHEGGSTDETYGLQVGHERQIDPWLTPYNRTAWLVSKLIGVVAIKKMPLLRWTNPGHRPDERLLW